MRGDAAVDDVASPSHDVWAARKQQAQGAVGTAACGAGDRRQVCARQTRPSAGVQRRRGTAPVAVKRQIYGTYPDMLKNMGMIAGTPAIVLPKHQDAAQRTAPGGLQFLPRRSGTLQGSAALPGTYQPRHHSARCASTANHWAWLIACRLHEALICCADRPGAARLTARLWLRRGRFSRSDGYVLRARRRSCDRAFAVNTCANGARGYTPSRGYYRRRPTARMNLQRLCHYISCPPVRLASRLATFTALAQMR